MKAYIGGLLFLIWGAALALVLALRPELDRAMDEYYSEWER